MQMMKAAIFFSTRSHIQSPQMTQTGVPPHSSSSFAASPKRRAAALQGLGSSSVWQSTEKVFPPSALSAAAELEDSHAPADGQEKIKNQQKGQKQVLFFDNIVLVEYLVNDFRIFRADSSGEA